jgi:hypothetical protein
MYIFSAMHIIQWLKHPTCLFMIICAQLSCNLFLKLFHWNYIQQKPFSLVVGYSELLLYEQAKVMWTKILQKPKNVLLIISQTEIYFKSNQAPPSMSIAICNRNGRFCVFCSTSVFSFVHIFKTDKGIWCHCTITMYDGSQKLWSLQK